VQVQVRVQLLIADMTDPEKNQLSQTINMEMECRKEAFIDK